MGVPRTLGRVGSTNQAITPVYTGTVIAAVSFSITNGIATIVLGAGNLPKTGYNGPNGFPTSNATTGAKFDINGPNTGMGQQVTLWGFTTATYFNGKTVTVLDNDGSGQFRFYFNHANVGSTNDTGNTAAIPVERVRTVHIVADSGLGTDTVYVGDLNISSTRYFAALSLTGQLAVDIAGDNIPPDRIFIVGSNAAGTDNVQVSLIY